MSEDLSPSSLFHKVLAGWRWLILSAIIGGIVGWVITTVMTPQYQAIAMLGIGIDYGRTHPLDDTAERHAFDRVRGLLLSDETLRGALERLDNFGTDGASSVILKELRERVRIAEKRSRWELVVFSPIKEEAAAIANAWAESAIHEIEQATRHAWRVGELQAQFFGLGCKYELAGEQLEKIVWVCEDRNFELDQDVLFDELLEEIQLSRGIIPALSYSLLQEAIVEEAPVLWGRGYIILMLTLAGFLAGMGFVLFRRSR